MKEELLDLGFVFGDTVDYCLRINEEDIFINIYSKFGNYNVFIEDLESGHEVFLFSYNYEKLKQLIEILK